ncbi:MAG: SDR family oxidoreductase [Rhodospirillum sp.]|nr:SDR family oxidoreductase [Rhodospirillum sp.]
MSIARTIDTFRLDGRHALITGGSKGLGAGCAEALAGAGANVTVVGRSQTDLDAVAQAIRAQGVEARILTTDVTELKTFARAVAALPSIDIFVNNAGTNKPQGFLDVDVETFDKVMDLNLRAAFFAAQAVARAMVAEGRGGSIINMTSQAGHRALRDRAVYSASKFALEGLTKAMALELSPKGIRVNAVAPTFVSTPLTEPFLSQPEFRNYVDNKILLPRLGEIEDVAAAVLYLASPAAAMVTGTSLLVDGGWTAH